MFWDFVISGLKVLTYWETYMSGLGYLAMPIFLFIIVGMVMENDDNTRFGVFNARVGVLLGTVLLPAVQVTAKVVMVITLSPIIFGFAEDAAWGFPWRLITMAPGTFFKFVGALIVVSIVLSFIPILGKLQALQTLVLGGIALIFVLRILDSVSQGIVVGQVDFVPGFWFLAGIIVIGCVMSWVGTMVAALILTAFNLEDTVGEIIMLPVVSLFGFIPVFIYGAYLGAQVRGGF